MTLRCVIVDDSAALLGAAKKLLERQGIAVVGLATNGDEAQRLMEQLQPDVMLIDLDLGRESGFELVRRLHATDGAPSPSILISSYDQTDFSTPIAASPAIGFLPKSELSAATVRRLVARAQAEGLS
jgi:DNA-binding NarL/FixJ family response regulator